MTSFGVLAQPSLSLLPLEVLEVILAQLPYKFLITTCVSVCPQWHEVIRNPAFLPWKKLYHRYKMAPSTPSSSLLLCQGGGDDGGGGGDDDDGVLTAQQVVARLSVRHGTVQDLNTCLVSIIRAVGRTHSVPQGTSHSLLQGHRLYQLARDTLNHLDAALLPPPHSLWHLVTTIVTLSHDVWDIHALILLLLRPGSLFTPCVVLEGLYSMALLLLHATSHPIGLPLRYHYQLYYALYLYENNWGALPGGTLQAKRETHAGQQSTERLVQVKSSVQFTHEQLRIISHPLQSDHVVKIVAFAGTGKTTTLLQLCKRRPDQRFLLVVYNKSVQEHCEKTFPNNTTVKTAHAMAYASVGSSYQAVHKFSMNITASSLNEFLPSKKGVGNKLRRVALAKNTLERYLNSADEDLSRQHVPTVDKLREALDDDYRLKVILPDAEAIWNEMKRCSATQALPMTQEGQLKLWQLSRPKLTGYDVVMVDEGQDMNPAMLDVFSRQSCAKVIVGDPYQQIYSFRGAINALENVTSTHTFYLTQSFRFGPEVAYVAQCVLETLCRAEGRTLVGGHKRDCIIATGEDIEASCPARKMRTAYLGRSNCEVYETALMMCRKESYASFTMTFAGGLDKYGLDTLMDIFKLSQVEKGKGTAVSLGIKNGLVAKFRSVASLKIFANNLDDRDMGNKVNMFNYSGSNTPRHVQLLKMRCSAPQDTAQITFSTIHKAKGMEWDHVVLLAGTLATCLSHVNDPRGVLGRDEINLLYVSVTRAKKYLTVNATMLEVLRLSKERMEVVVGGGEVQEGCVCVQCKEPVDGKELLVTKVFAMNVMMSCELTTLEGGYLCHACSTQPHRDVPGGGRATLVSALEPNQDYSRTARLMLMCGRLPPQPTTD